MTPTELAHDVPQRFRELQDAVDGAQQSGVCGDSDPHILGRLIPVSMCYAGVPGAMSSGPPAGLPDRKLHQKWQ